MLTRRLEITMLVDEDFHIDSFKDDYDGEFNEVVSVVETVHKPNLIKIGNVFGNIPVYVEDIKANRTLEDGDGPLTNIILYVEMKPVIAIIPSIEHNCDTITSDGVEYVKGVYVSLNGKTLEAYDLLPDELNVSITNGSKKLTINDYLALLNKKPVVKKTKTTDTTVTPKGKKK